MNEQEFKRRTKQLVLRAIKVVEALPKTPTGRILGKQLLRSATSVGANYRAACRAKSNADMIKESLLSDLMQEANEIVAITVSSVKTLRSQKKDNPKSTQSWPNCAREIGNPKSDGVFQ